MRFFDHILGFDTDFVDTHRWEEDDFVKQIILGGLFGRATIVKTSDRHYYYREERAFKYNDYLVWKNSVLHITHSDYHTQVSPKGRKHGTILWSKNHPYMANLHKTLYKNGKKTITQEHLDAINGPGLLVWYLDDGHYDDRAKTCGLRTSDYTRAERWTIIRWFRERWSIQDIRIDRELDLRFNVTSTERLLSILYPLYKQYHLPECLARKLGHFARENVPRIEGARKKDRLYKNRGVRIRPSARSDLMKFCTSDREVMGLLYGTVLPRKVLGAVLLPFPSDNKHVYFDETVLKDLPNRKYIGWFHSHLKDSFMPSPEDVETHLRLFPDKAHAVMMIINMATKGIKAFDHIKADGGFRECRIKD